MAKLAFLGLGLMGTPMATRLLEAGNDLTVWNRTTEKTTPLAERGAAVASTPAQAVAAVDAALLAFGEALALGDTLGLDRSVLLDVLAESPIASTVQAKRPNVESGQYPPSFKLSLALKDLRLVDGIADRAGQHLPVATATRDWLDQAAQAGGGDLDFSAVIATI